MKSIDDRLQALNIILLAQKFEQDKHKKSIVYTVNKINAFTQKYVYVTTPRYS